MRYAIFAILLGAALALADDAPRDQDVELTAGAQVQQATEVPLRSR